MLKIIADAGIPSLKGVLEPYCSIEYLPSSSISSETVKDADILLIRTRTICNKQLLENSTVKYIGTATIGFDHIDLEYCHRMGIHWTNAAGCNADSVCQYVINSILLLEKQNKLTLSGKTFGIIGLGNVGSRVKKALELLGLNVLANDPPRARREGNKAYVSLETLLSQSDIISLHVPLIRIGADKTFHLISKKEISKLKEGAVFINTSRGEVVNNFDLLMSLKNGKVSNSILDVWENEPSPNIELINLSAISTPHIAGYSLDGKINATSILIQNLSRHYNLSLSDWKAEISTSLTPSIIKLEGDGVSAEQIAKEALIQTYDVLSDDKSFRANLNYFENLRINYPLRRDVNTFTVEVKNGTPLQAELLLKYGFRRVICT